MREPRWIRAAYASAPALRTPRSFRPSTVEAHIECWNGTVEELCSVVTALSDVGPKAASVLQAASVSWADGSRSEFRTLAALTEALTPDKLDQAMAIRIEAEGSNGVSVVLVARQKLPGLALTVSGQDAASSLGTAEILFQRMMVGYVDRMGGLRPLAWMATALAPMILISWALGQQEIGVLVRIVLVLVAALSGVATFQLSYPKLLVSSPFVLAVGVPTKHAERWKALVLAGYRHRYSRAALAICGALIVGVVSNKLSDLIAFP